MERTSHSSTPVKGEAALSSTEKRIYIFEKAPVRRAVLQQMLPTVAGQMVALLYKIVRKMVTNFHQPQSTLLLLVSAFVRGNWRKIYDYALEHDFRFLSYGDSSLLIP